MKRFFCEPKFLVFFCLFSGLNSTSALRASDDDGAAVIEMVPSGNPLELAAALRDLKSLLGDDHPAIAQLEAGATALPSATTAETAQIIGILTMTARAIAYTLRHAPAPHGATRPTLVDGARGSGGRHLLLDGGTAAGGGDSGTLNASDDDAHGANHLNHLDGASSQTASLLGHSAARRNRPSATTQGRLTAATLFCTTAACGVLGGLLTNEWASAAALATTAALLYTIGGNAVPRVPIPKTWSLPARLFALTGVDFFVAGFGDLLCYWFTDMAMRPGSTLNIPALRSIIGFVMSIAGTVAAVGLLNQSPTWPTWAGMTLNALAAALQTSAALYPTAFGIKPAT